MTIGRQGTGRVRRGPGGPATATQARRAGISSLGEALDSATTQERRRALRALLQHPLLGAAGSLATEFGLVRRHINWLKEWLAYALALFEEHGRRENRTPGPDEIGAKVHPVLRAGFSAYNRLPQP